MRRGPPHALSGAEASKKSFLFLLEEKIRRAQNQKSRENFFAGWRVVASGGGAASLVGVLLKESSDFVQKVPPVYNFSILGRDCLAASPLGQARFARQSP